ncbi:MAG: helix-turn-helix domain-containing protein [Candidatus Dormibacteria bacterium]
MSTDPLYGQFGERLRRARLAAGVTQESLGRRARVARTTITNMESGAQAVTLRMLYDLAQALDLAPESLLPHTAEPEGTKSDHSELVASMSLPALERRRLASELDSLPRNAHEWVMRQMSGVGADEDV